MAGETRRSGRATKGQHRKNLEEEEAPAQAPKRQQKNKSKSAKPTSTEPEGEDDEEEAIIRCICGANEDEEGWMMISCEQCTAWQHNLCMGITEVEENLPEAYYCEQCRPEDHAPLIAAMKRGEKPWEERIAKRRAEEKAAKSKKGKKGRGKGARASGATEPVEASSTPAKSTPARSAAASVVPEAGNKRKFDAVESSNGNGQTSPAVPPPSHSTTTTTAPKAPIAPTTNTPAAASTETRKSTGPEQQPKRAKSVSESAVRRESLASPIPKVESLDQLPKERVPVAKALSTDLKGLIQKAVKDGSYKLQKGDAVDVIGLKLALDIEHAMYSLYKTTTGQYREQFLAVKFNMKKNQALVSQILSGSLTPGELAEMSSDDMASEELQKERAAMKEAIDKQVILVEDSGPRYRKTHKGEELIGGDNVSKPEESTYTPPVRRLTLEQESISRGPIDTGSPPPSAELPEDYDRPPLSADTANSSGPSNFNIQQVWKSVQSPDLSKPGPPKPARRQSSQQNQDLVMRDVTDDPELDRLLKDEDDMAVSPAPVTDPSAVWQGRVRMANVGDFTAVARFAAGGDVGQKIPYSELIPEALEIDGRIAIQRANEYIGGMRYSQTTDVCTLALSPIDTEADRKGFGQIFNYFREKERWGVIAQYKHQAIRDVYMVTVEAGMSPLPSFITMLEHSEIEELRPSNLLLLTLVVRTRNPAPPPALPIPAQQSTPINQNHPQFSPVSAGSSTFSVPHHAPAPQVPVSPLAAQILGPFVQAPVVTQILGSVGDMSEVQLQNLRDILEREPSTRDDIAKLGMHLQQRQKEIGT